MSVLQLVQQELFRRPTEEHFADLASLRDATRAAAIVIALSEDVPMHAAAETWLAALAARHRGAAVRVTALLNEEPWTISLEQAGPVGTVKENAAALYALPRKRAAACAAME